MNPAPVISHDKLLDLLLETALMLLIIPSWELMQDREVVLVRLGQAILSLDLLLEGALLQEELMLPLE